MSYIWIAIGQISKKPVFASDKKYPTHRWLSTRTNPEAVKLFRSGGPNGIIQVCTQCFLDYPNQPARTFDHD